MPSTISKLLDKVSLQWTDVVKWSEHVPSSERGIYIVSLSTDPDQNFGCLRNAPIDREAVREWISRVPTLKLNNELPSSLDEVVNHLKKYWLPDESILYIGQTSGETSTLRKRVDEYYRHRLGNNSPHAGGHWIKTLSILEKTFVHYAESRDLRDAEHKLIKAFAANVSSSTKCQLGDAEHPFPFANIRLPSVDKIHGITNSKHLDKRKQQATSGEM